jgi:hypothetical protein
MCVPTKFCNITKPFPYPPQQGRPLLLGALYLLVMSASFYGYDAVMFSSTG